MARRLLRRMLPIRIRAQAKNVRQRLGVGQKIRLLGHGPEQVQGDHAALCHQAGQQALCMLNSRRIRRRLRTAHAGFHEGRRGRSQLRAAREIQAQGMLFQPTLCVFEGEEGILLLAPVRRSCCLELLCFQDDSVLSKLGRVSFRSGEMPAEFLSKHTAGRWAGHAGNWSGARFSRARPTATPCVRDRARCSP